MAWTIAIKWNAEICGAIAPRASVGTGSSGQRVKDFGRVGSGRVTGQCDWQNRYIYYYLFIIDPVFVVFAQAPKKKLI